jgi:hypothetical protein
VGRPVLACPTVLAAIRVVVVVLVALAGCEKKSDKVELDFKALDIRLGQKIEKIVEHPAIDSGMDAFVDSLGASPKLLAAGEKLLGQLGADPKLSAQLESLINDIGASPRMQQLALSIATAHPGEPIEDLVGTKIEKTWAEPALTKPLEADFQDLIGKVKLDHDVELLGEKLEARIQKVLEDPARVAKWSKRLTELNGGSTPDRAKATDLYAENAWSDAHVEQFATALLKDPTLRDECAAIVAELLALKPIAQELTNASVQLASDPKLRQAAMDLMLELLETQPKFQRITELQRQVVLDPKMVALVQRLAHMLFTDPDVARVVGAHIDRMTSNPKLQALFDDFLDHW